MRRPLLACLALLAILTSGCSDLVAVRVTTTEPPRVEAPEESTVVAADGSVLATLRVEHRVAVEREQLPQVLIDAIVAAEDQRFYTHDGVDVRAVLRAAVANRRAGEVVQGGSTITQQLVKNRYFPDAAQTLERKAAEAHLARRLEETATKDEILVDYLNTVYFGAGAYGVQAAARTYFGVDVEQLDLPRAALLAGLVRAPESASPSRAPQRALAVRGRVLTAMVETGVIEDDAAAAADATPLGVQPPASAPATRHPYFVAHVVRTLLADPRFGPDEASRVRQLYGGGLRIETTLDPRVQDAADRAARSLLTDPEDPEVGIAVVRPSDGHLVATVGGRDFATREFDLATQARRQPGSAMKTFALVTALRQGARLDDEYDAGSGVLEREPGLEPWQVASNSQGLLDLRTAFVASANGAFARLALQVGPQRIADQARLMGVTSDLGSAPALVLGGVPEGVSPLEMATAYGTLASAGVARPTVAVTAVRDRRGWLVWQPDTAPVVAMDGEVAWLTTQALRGAIEEGTGTNARLDRPAAGKTGTSQDHADAWFVGFTPELSAAVWVGYPDAERPLLAVDGVPRVTGGTFPARIWQRLMTQALAGTPPQEFPYPTALEISVEVDPLSGGLATPWCPLPELRRGLRGVLPAEPCTLHTSSPPPRAETATALTPTSSPTPTPSPAAPLPPPTPASPALPPVEVVAPAPG